MTTFPTLRGVFRAARTTLLGYAITLGASLILMGVLVLGIALGGDSGESDTPARDLDIKAIATLIGMPFQLTAMALGGSVRLGAGEFSVSLFAPPLLLTAIFFIAVFRLSRRAERANPTASTAERAALAVASGLVLAVVATVATRVLAMRDDHVSMHAATVGLFFGTLLLTAGAGLLGREAATRSLWPQWLVDDARRAVHLVAQHLFVWIVVGGVFAVVFVLVRANVEAALYAVIWLPTVALSAFSLGHLDGLSIPGESSQFAWDLGWATGIGLPALAVLTAVGAAVAWHLRRTAGPEKLAQPSSWLALPATYAGLGLLATLLGTVRFSGGIFGGVLSVSYHPAYWLIPILAMWGLAIEVMSRQVAPTLADAFPEGIRGRLARGPVVTATAPEAPAAPQERTPMSPTDRARMKKGLVGIGVLAFIGIAGFVAIKVVGATAYSPEHRARAYLDAVVGGDVAKAVELAPVSDEASDALLTKEEYAAAEDRITGYEIKKVEWK